MHRNEISWSFEPVSSDLWSLSLCTKLHCVVSLETLLVAFILYRLDVQMNLVFIVSSNLIYIVEGGRNNARKRATRNVSPRTQTNEDPRSERTFLCLRVTSLRIIKNRAAKAQIRQYHPPAFTMSGAATDRTAADFEVGAVAHVTFRVRCDKLGHGEEVFLVAEHNGGGGGESQKVREKQATSDKRGDIERRLSVLLVVVCSEMHAHQFPATTAAAS